MDSQTRGIIEALYREDFGLVYVTTGGGVALAEWLHAVPGASSTLLDTRVPYSIAARVELVSDDAGSPAVSYETVEGLLRWAFGRARDLTPRGRQPVALTCSAALSTNRERRGPNHAWLGIRTARFATVSHLDLPDPSRDEQEYHLSRVLLSKLGILVAERHAERLLARRAS